LRWIALIALTSCSEAPLSHLDVEPGALELGAVGTGRTMRRRLLAKNTGAVPIVIESFASDDPDLTITAVTGVEIAPQGGMEVIVDFRSLEERTIEAEVTIASSAGTLRVPVLGSVVERAACAPAFDPPTGISSSLIPFEQNPALATDGMGNWIAVYSSDELFGGPVTPDFDIFFSRSSDGGMSWTPGKALSPSHAMNDGEREDVRAQIAYADGTWIAVWQSIAFASSATDIYVSRSDDGEVFSNPQVLGSEFGDALPVIATDGTSWVIAWHAHTLLSGDVGDDGDLAFVRSTDAGGSWSNVAALNTHAATDDGFDGEVSLAAGAPGHLFAVWSSTAMFGPDNEILFSRSTDGGVVWSEARTVDALANGELQPDFTPAVSADATGNVVVVWPTEGGNLMVGSSADHGETWRDPLLIGPLTGRDARPSIATDGEGTFVIVWHSYSDVGGTGTEGDILAITSLDAGRTWGAPAAINVDPDGGSIDDQAATILSDGGRWLVAFESASEIRSARGVCP
jgi:hypothetical protein